MADVVLKNVGKSFDRQPVVQNVNITIPDREFFILVGPSGCGKSTTLRMIAGLEDISEGTIAIDSKVVNHIPPKNRDIAMVFQNYALYPHMTVYDNMAFGLKLRGFSKTEIDVRVREAADILGLTDYLERKPKALSGGQRQRVAVGRCIVRKPKVFLFDEPLSNLDAKLRVQMRLELVKLHEKLQTTMVYVTHDQVEAMTMGNRICVMKDGLVQQVATPMDLYNEPTNRFVAQFIGSPPMNMWEAAVVKTKTGIAFKNDSFTVGGNESLARQLSGHVGKTVSVGLRAEDISDKLFYTYDINPESLVSARIDVVEPLGSDIFLYTTAGTVPIVARFPPYVKPDSAVPIDLIFNTDKLHVFDRETGESLVDWKQLRDDLSKRPPPKERRLDNGAKAP